MSGNETIPIGSGPRSSLFLIAVELFFIVLLAATLVLDIYKVFYQRRPTDFAHRCNEVHCVLDGINPYDVAYGVIDSPKYTTVLGPSAPFWKKGLKAVGGYPPWVYTFFSGFAALPFRVSFLIYAGIEILALVVLAGVGFRLALNGGFSRISALAIAGTPFLLAWPIGSQFTIHNLGVVQLLFLVFMAEALNHKRDVVAGVFFALFASKPHLALPLGLVLLLHRKWKTVVTAGLICVVASLPPAVVLRVSPISLMLDVVTRHADHDLGAIALIPEKLSPWLKNILSAQGLTLLMLLVSSAFVASWSAALYHRPNWYERLAPAVIMAPLWTYFCIHDFSLYAFPMLVASIQICKRRPEIGRVPVYAKLALALLLANVLLVGYSGTSCLANSLGFRMMKCDMSIVAEIGRQIKPGEAGYRLSWDVFRIANWIMLACWTLSFRWLARADRKTPDVPVAPSHPR